LIAAGAVLADHTRIEARKAERARVFVRILEHKKLGKLIARIERNIHITSAIHTAMIDPAALGREISTMEGLVWV